MKKYEMMVIIQNDRSEAEAKGFLKDKVIKKVKDEGGKVTFEDFWGARGFAYMINQEKWGYYAVIQFDGAPEIVKTITTDFNILKGLVRFMIMKVDKKAPEPVSYSDMQKNWEAQKREKQIADAEAEEKATKPAAKADKKETPKTEETKETRAKEATTEKTDEPSVDSSIDSAIDAL